VGGGEGEGEALGGVAWSVRLHSFMSVYRGQEGARGVHSSGHHEVSEPEEGVEERYIG